MTKWQTSPLLGNSYSYLFIEVEVWYWKNWNRVCNGGKRGRFQPSPSPSKLFFYHINFKNFINLLFNDLKFYRFINILGKFWCSSPGQSGARTFLTKNVLKFFVLWSLKVSLSFNCFDLNLYYLKVVCTQFFPYLFQDWLFHSKIHLYFNNFWCAK